MLVQKGKPDAPTTVKVTVWWQRGGACSSGPISNQVFATGTWMIPVATDNRGITVLVPKTGGTVSHTFVPNDKLCLSIANMGTESENDIKIYAHSASQSGTVGVSRLEGPFTYVTSLNLQLNGTTMSTAGSPSGMFSLNTGSTRTFAAVGIFTASNANDWPLHLVQGDQPGLATQVSASIWWQNSQCTNPMPGQIFASGTFVVPVGQDLRGVSFDIPKTSGTVSRVFAAPDKLCLSLTNQGFLLFTNIQIYANTASSSGTAGVSRLAGPFTQK